MHPYMLHARSCVSLYSWERVCYDTSSAVFFGAGRKRPEWPTEGCPQAAKKALFRCTPTRCPFPSPHPTLPCPAPRCSRSNISAMKILGAGDTTTTESFTTAVYDILPANPNFTHFHGSLTTPPCTEVRGICSLGETLTQEPKKRLKTYRAPAMFRRIEFSEEEQNQGLPRIARPLAKGERWCANIPGFVHPL